MADDGKMDGRTDGDTGRTDGKMDGQHQINIPPPSAIKMLICSKYSRIKSGKYGRSAKFGQ